jgi:hypothetical protein
MTFGSRSGKENPAQTRHLGITSRLRAFAMKF